MGTKGETRGTVTPLYEALDVWKRVSRTRIVRYRCFRELSSGLYSVQSADFYRIPWDAKQVAHLERQYLELLAEQAPDERTSGFDSLEAAIEAHDRDFASTEPRDR